MPDFILGGPVLAISRIFADLGLAPNVLVIAVICAGFGTIFLSRHTFRLGGMSYPINFCALFAGAIAANLLLSDVRLPLGPSFERPLAISIGGMLFASLITLLLMPRDRESR